MNRKILHTPDGVRDIYKGECERKQVIGDRVGKVLLSFGYEPIETPTFEFFDVFSSDVGTIPSRELYKFFDRDGNTLVLRPDFTPSIARAASRYFLEETGPIRLYYQGNTFINHSSYQGRMKESTHTGAELIGDSSAMADAEIAAMVAQSLLSAGLKEFQISLGHVQYFESLAEAACLTPETEEELKSLIRNKNSFGVEKLLTSLGLPQDLMRVLSALPSLFGGEEILYKAKEMAGSCRGAAAAADRLLEVNALLKAYGVDGYITYDLGMMSTYMYYTGIIFRGYTYGTGDAVVKGGRYDSLLRHFGKDAPSIGFVVVIDQLLNALARQKIPVEGIPERITLRYTAENRESAIARARELRAEGKHVVLEKG